LGAIARSGIHFLLREALPVCVVLLRASALERIGGLPTIAARLIDDCALAAGVNDRWDDVARLEFARREHSRI